MFVLRSGGRGVVAAVRLSRRASAVRPDPGKDYYAFLGVGSSASDDEIRQAFHRMALKYHPDTREGGLDPAEARRRFVEVSEAYQVLRQQRAEYDALRRAARGDRNYGPQHPRDRVTWEDFRTYSGSASSGASSSGGYSAGYSAGGGYSASGGFAAGRRPPADGAFFNDAEFMRWYAAEFASLFSEAQAFVQEEMRRRPHFGAGGGGGARGHYVKIEMHGRGGFQKIKIKTYKSDDGRLDGVVMDPVQRARLGRLSVGAFGLLAKVAGDVLSGAGPIGRGLRNLLASAGLLPDPHAPDRASAAAAEWFGAAERREAEKPRDPPPRLEMPSLPQEYHVAPSSSASSSSSGTTLSVTDAGGGVLAGVRDVHRGVSWVLTDASGRYRLAEAVRSAESGSGGGMVEVLGTGQQRMASAHLLQAGGLFAWKSARYVVRNEYREPWLEAELRSGLTSVTLSITDAHTSALLGSATQAKSEAGTGAWSFSWQPDAMHVLPLQTLRRLQHVALLLAVALPFP